MFNYQTLEERKKQMEPSSSNTVHRIAYIDTAKAICIFLMIVGHWTNIEWLRVYIYSFHMPTMFVISGYLYKPHSWKNTIVAFSIPLLCFSLLSLGVKIIIGEMSPYSISFPKTFFLIFHYRYGLGESLMTGDWFLWALIALRFMFGDISWMSGLKKYYIPIAIFSIIYMTLESRLISIDTIFRGYIIGRAIPCLPFFCFGFWLKNKQWEPKKLPLTIIILIFAVFLTVPPVNKATGIIDNGYGYSYIIFFICAIAISLLIFWISNKIPPNKFIVTISKGTFVVLGTHMPILLILNKLLPPKTEQILPFITIALCYYIIIFCEKYCPILLGKIKH